MIHEGPEVQSVAGWWHAIIAVAYAIAIVYHGIAAVEHFRNAGGTATTMIYSKWPLLCRILKGW